MSILSTMKTLTYEQLQKAFCLQLNSVEKRKDFATGHGFTVSYITDIYHGRRHISDRILDILGYEVRYVRRAGEVKKIAVKK